MTGIYIHVPFCNGKCPYCDFYSKGAEGDMMDLYVENVITEMGNYNGISVGTIYFGGGTPSVIGSKRLRDILSFVKKVFQLSADCEITVEVNPADASESFFSEISAAGVNRISMGLQSANAKELALLGRRHNAEQVAEAVEMARAAGIKNISLDLMLALPGQTEKMLGKSLDFVENLEVEHVSAYILKIEEGTPFCKRYTEKDLPTDDETADLYLFMAKWLKENGYSQYEISNFAKPGMESRHNLIYWRCEEYLGFGPSAHSFFKGKRFYNISQLPEWRVVDDGIGGDFEEFAMLALRLSEGLIKENCVNRFGNGGKLFEKVKENIKKCPTELIRSDNESISLTSEGFVVSNQVIGTLVDV